MTKYYGIMPWDIGKLTLFQWQDYMEHIEKIYRLFHPEPKKEGSRGSPSSSNRASNEELRKRAKRYGLKTPSKGM